MANPPHPARREPGALWLLGLSTLCAAGAATLLLTGHPAAGGAAGLAASISCFAATTVTGGSPSFALGAAGPLVDAAVLAPVAWASRTDDTTIAALALVTLSAALVGSYERARAAALGYRTRRIAWLALVRRALPAAGLIAGGAWLTASLWAALGLAVFTLAVRAMGVVLQEREGRAHGAAGVTTGGTT
jgi:hypothetical protein